MDYHGAIKTAGEKYGVADTTDLLAALLHLLRYQHETSVGYGATSNYNDGLDHLTGQHSTTLAESLAAFAKMYASMMQHNATARRNSGDVQNADSMEEYVVRLRAMLSVLEYFIPVWNFKGTDTQQGIERVERELAKDPNVTLLGPAPPVKDDDDPPKEEPKPRF